MASNQPTGSHEVVPNPQRRLFLQGTGSGVLIATISPIVLTACGGGAKDPAKSTPETTPVPIDTMPPSVKSLVDSNGNAIIQNQQTKKYSTSADIGKDTIYTIQFDEKLGASEYTIPLLGTNGQAMPGITAVVKATDASNLTYTLTIQTTKDFVFDKKTSEVVPLAITVADVRGNQSIINIEHTVNDVAPVVPAGSDFAKLADMTVSDNSGNPAIGGGPSIIINAGGVTDPLGRTIVYSFGPDSMLPPSLVINSTTGVISGTYDSGGLEPFSVTIKAQTSGSSQSVSKTVIITIEDVG